MRGSGLAESLEQRLRRRGASQADGSDLDAGAPAEKSLGAERGHGAIRVRLRAEQLQPARRRPSRPGVLADRLREYAGGDLADIVVLSGAVGTAAQRLGAGRVLVGAKPVLRGRGVGRERKERGGERQRHPHGCALQVGCEVQAESSRSKYQGSCAASTWEAGMVTVAGRKKASG